MIRIDPFEPGDLAAMPVQPGQSELPFDRMAHGMGLAACGRAFTVRPYAGARPVFCGGTIETHRELATLWSVVAVDAGPYMIAITRRVRRFAQTLPHRRVDAMIRSGFDPAKRWMAMLGFREECVLGGYFENGDNAMIYTLHRWPGHAVAGY